MNDLLNIQPEPSMDTYIRTNWSKFVEYLNSLGAIYLDSDCHNVVTCCDRLLLTSITNAVRNTDGSEQAIIKIMCMNMNNKSLTNKVVKHALDYLVTESDVFTDTDERNRVIYKVL